MSCCHYQRLGQLLTAHAVAAVDDDLALHVETCEACRQHLEQMAAGPEWWSKTRAALSKPCEPLEEPRCEPVEGPWLGFLQPSDFPYSLGRLGTYEVIGVIGTGGFGAVLKAHDPALNRYVAVKALLPHLATSAAARRRFAREARAAAAVVNDYVIPIHAVQEANGIPYLVMPYVPGHSLQERVEREGPLKAREIVRIAMQTALGLAAAHAQGLVHRDVKPGNILLETDLERVRITDFGLARTIDEASQTHSGLLAGTPQYMSPEQARGEPVDHRSDLFSLGSVMYCMCTGHSPFRADSTVAVLHRIGNDRPRSIREINPEIPLWLCRLVDRLMHKDASRRINSAAEVAALLEGFLAHLQRPGAHAPPRLPAGAWPRRAWEQLRGRAVPSAAAACAMVALVVAAWPVPPRPAFRRNEVLDRPQPKTPQADGVALEPPIDRELEAARAALAVLERSFWPRSDGRHDIDNELGHLRQLIEWLEQSLVAGTSLTTNSHGKETE